MKNCIFFSIVVLLLLASCTSRDSKTAGQPEILSGQEASSIPPKLVISIPSVVLDKLISDSVTFDLAPPNNLRALWRYDKAFSELVAKSSSIGPHVLTRKVNPCCPCDETQTGCCDCPEMLYWGAPSSMNTSLTFDGTVISAVKADNIDLYQIPTGMGNGSYNLEIKGNNIRPPLKLTVTIQDGTIDF